MIWLASFPRSGSTFFRILLDEVYGIESSTFHREEAYPVDPDYASYPVVKTHLLPGELIPEDPSIPAVYLVRDGRDCVVSLAHYRKQLIAADSDFERNLQEAIDAAGGSHFGGWSEHVRQWRARASLVIRFEELVVDPIACAERLRPWLDLPEPRLERLPDFAELKSKDFKYGSGLQHGFDPSTRSHWRAAKFRRGKVGAWRDELPERLQLRFLRLHGGELIRLGYIDPPTAVGGRSASKRSAARQTAVSGARTARGSRSARHKRVLIDASKLLDPRIDGIKRYVQELLRAMVPAARQRRDAWEIDVCFGAAGTFPLLSIADDLEAGRPPLELIPRLFRPDEVNPLFLSKQRLAQLGGRWSWARVGETVRYNYFKTVRSIQKRKRELDGLRGRLWDRTSAGAASAGRCGYDLLHLTLPNTWPLYADFDAPRLVTVHDLCHLVCPEFQNAANNRSLAAGLRAAQQSDCDYLAVSESTREQMIRLLGVEGDRIAVVHEACDERTFRPVARAEELRRVRSKYKLPDGPYLLSLGTIEPRKNLISVVRAFNLLTEESPGMGASLVIAGSFGWGNARALEQAVRARPRIHRIGHVDDADLAALYSGAAAFCYVSHYEGFGLPLLEAMSCGVPCVYGDVSSMPEIAAGAGLPAMPGDVEQIKQRLRQLLEDAELRRRLSWSAVFRSLDFSWSRAAEETFACYERFVEARRQKAGTVKQDRCGGSSTTAPTGSSTQPQTCEVFEASEVFAARSSPRRDHAAA